MKFLLSRNGMITIFVVLLVLIVFVFPVTIPVSITVPGRVMAEKSWYLSRAEDGSMSGVTREYLSGRTRQTKAFVAERGDVVKFSPNHRFQNMDSLSAGDTLGVVQSQLLSRRVEELRGEMEVLKATLASQQTGEKEPIVEEARRELELVKEEVSLQQAVLERQRALFEKGLLSEEEFEITRGQAQVAQLEMLAAEANLATVQSGEKPAVRAITHAQIQATERQLAVLQNQLNQIVIRSPIAGTVSFQTGGDTLMIVDSHARVAIIRVRWKYRDILQKGDEVLNEEFGVRGKVQRISDRVFQMNGEQVFSVFATVEDSTQLLPPGLITAWKIRGADVRPLGYIARFVRNNLTK